MSSPLRRCRETAEPTAQALGVTVEIDPRVGEIPTPAALRPAERGPWLRKSFAGHLGARSRATSTTTPGGGRSPPRWRARGNTAVFSHYVATNAVVSQLLGDARVLAFRPDHASITVLETDGTDLVLVEMGREAATGRALAAGRLRMRR